MNIYGHILEYLIVIDITALSNNFRFIFIGQLLIMDYCPFRFLIFFYIIFFTGYDEMSFDKGIRIINTL